MNHALMSLSSKSLTSHSSCNSSISILNNSSMNMKTKKPTWLLSMLADVEERMKKLVCNNSSSISTGQQDLEIGDTFAQRAEAYYKTRPQLLSLLQDLYNAYLTLSDRYIHTIAKTHHNHHGRGNSSQISVIDNEYYDYEDQLEDGDGETSQIDSDMESSLSYEHQQLPPPATLPLTASVVAAANGDIDTIVTEIVMKNVECDILLDEANTTERRYNDSSRKIELQKSLLEVLESERLILLNENAELGYKVGALAEENKALASESLFMRRKAGELAKCMLKMRENQRVCMLSRKIEDLQGQIYGLEMRNKEYYEQLVKRDLPTFQFVHETESSHGNGNGNGNGMNKSKYPDDNKEVTLEVCFQMGRLKKRTANGNGSGSANKGSTSSWWARVKKMDLFLCGHNHPTSA